MRCVIQDSFESLEIIIHERVTVGVCGDRKRLDNIFNYRIRCLRGDLADTKLYSQPKNICTIPQSVCRIGRLGGLGRAKICCTLNANRLKKGFIDLVETLIAKRVSASDDVKS